MPRASVRSTAAGCEFRVDAEEDRAAPEKLNGLLKPGEHACGEGARPWRSRARALAAIGAPVAGDLAVAEGAKRLLFVYQGRIERRAAGRPLA